MRLNSKPHQLADYLRESIRQGRLVTPLPGMRLWSQQLGVSRRTLTTALQILQTEGWLTLHPRGTRLNPQSPAAAQSSASSAPQRVRWLIDGSYRHNLHTHHGTFDLLHERLRLRGIELTSEICTPVRLRKIASQPDVANELFLLGSLSPIYQRLFADTKKALLVLGEVGPGLTLPHITADQAGAVRHAAFHLLRKGHTHLILFHIQSDAMGMRSSQQAFRDACAEWKPAPVNAQLIGTKLDQTSLLSSVRRLAKRVTKRTGIIVLSPVPLTMVTTALLQHGISVPAQAETVALLHSAELIQVYPPPTHYEWPRAAVVRHITAAAEHYFASGILPTGSKNIAAEMAKPV